LREHAAVNFISLKFDATIRSERREEGAGEEDEMPDFLQWSAALLALLGLTLWCWSGRIRVPQPATIARGITRRKRRLGRVAVLATVISALLQAAVASTSPEQIAEVWLQASASPAADISTDQPA
jgi:hypothetical protein